MIDPDYIRYGDILTDKFIASETWMGLRFNIRIHSRMGRCYIIIR